MKNTTFIDYLNSLKKCNKIPIIVYKNGNSELSFTYVSLYQ